MYRGRPHTSSQVCLVLLSSACSDFGYPPEKRQADLKFPPPQAGKICLTSRSLVHLQKAGAREGARCVQPSLPQVVSSATWHGGGVQASLVASDCLPAFSLKCCSITVHTGSKATYTHIHTHTQTTVLPLKVLPTWHPERNALK